MHIIRGAAQLHGGTSQALARIKIFEKTQLLLHSDFSFFSPYGDNMLDNLRDPSSDFFEINLVSYLREETWGPCQ